MENKKWLSYTEKNQHKLTEKAYTDFEKWQPATYGTGGTLSDKTI
jgi:hypothetical protein